MPHNSTAISDNNDIVENNAPIVIVGAGLAGLFTALKLAPHPVTVISPTRLGRGASSFWAQGGIAAAIGEGDHPDKHTQDTIRVGGGIVDPEIVAIVTSEAGDRIRDLLTYGVPFDKDLEGKLVLSREAAHSDRRIVRVRGDMAGKAIMSALIDAVHNTSSINILEGYRAESLEMLNEQISGITISNFQNTCQKHFISTPAVVIASGGVGGLYEVTTNPATSSGEGMGLAAVAGAIIADPEFIQFHPTAINIGADPAPLATEALRGEGAILIDKNGRRFMPDNHPDAELAPRDIVARAVFTQVISNKGAFLDCREAIGSKFPDMYPTVFDKCMDAGINPIKEPIPVAPAAHYHMGGILTDKHGRTTIKGLWACGEAASTGMHGANRLASNSLLEAVVFASRIAEDLKNIQPELPPISPRRDTEERADDNTKHISQLRSQMTKGLGVVRNKSDMQNLADFIRQTKQSATTSKAFNNMLVAAEIMTNAALNRTESRGAHYRHDYPHADKTYAHRSYYKYSDREIISYSAEEISFPEP